MDVACGRTGDHVHITIGRVISGHMTRAHDIGEVSGLRQLQYGVFIVGILLKIFA